MKDAFMPIVLTVIVIIAAVFFIMKIYTPQKQTVNALSESSEQAQVSMIAVADANGDEVTGVMVKALYEQYDGKVYFTLENDASPEESDFEEINDDDIYIKTVVRNKDNKALERIIFKKK